MAEVLSSNLSGPIFSFLNFQTKNGTFFKKPAYSPRCCRVIIRRYDADSSHTGVYNVHDQMLFLESMDKIRIIPAAGYAGEGISQGLASGLLVR